MSSGAVPDKNAPLTENARNEFEDNPINQESTTGMLTDAPSVLSSYKVVSYDSNILNSASSNYMQGLKEFLAKPIRIATGVFGPGTADLPAHMAEIVLDYTNFLATRHVWSDKLVGFLGIRATIVTRLLVNGNPFQQGRLLMSYNPMERETGTNTNIKRDVSLTQLTTLPHVELDVSCDTEAVLEIPYINLQTHLNMFNNSGGWGVLRLDKYIPFNYGTGSSTCPWEIWASLKDVQLVAPSKTNIINDPILAPLDAQMRTSNMKSNDVKDKEIEEQMSPLAKMFRSVGSVASYVPGVAKLSSLVGKLDWASAVNALNPAYFGWSKPVNEMPIMRMNQCTYQGTNTCDGVEQAFQLALATTNKVATMPELGGVDIDEMSIDYLKQIYAFAGYIEPWTTAQNPDTELYHVDLFPQIFASYYTNGAAQGLWCPTPMAFVAGCFQYWRGSFKIRLKLAKTSFHSGRLCLTFNPGYTPIVSGGTSSTNPLANTQESDYVHREFIDIREGNEFEFVIPYCSPVPYLQSGQPMGILQIFVLNPLRAPDTVASSIAIAVEVAAAEDMEFSRPTDPFYKPCILPGQNLEPLEAQMNSSIEQCKKVVAKPIGGCSVDSMDTKFAEVCIGEQIKSVKQLCLRTVWQSVDPRGSNGCIRPYALVQLTTLAHRSCPGYYDWISIISPLYAFSHGGIVSRAYALASQDPVS